MLKSNLLEENLEENPRNIKRIIGALMGYTNIDPGFKTNDFEEAIKYTISRGVSEQVLFSEFNPELDFDEDPNKWTEEYYSYARVYLKDNFCRKRIDHVKKVAHKLYPVTTPVQSVRKETPFASQNHAGNRNSLSGGQTVQGKKSMDQGYKQQNQNTISPMFVGAGIIALILIVALVLVIIK